MLLWIAVGGIVAGAVLFGGGLFKSGGPTGMGQEYSRMITNGRYYRQNMFEPIRDNLLHPDFQNNLDGIQTVQDLGTYGIPRVGFKPHAGAAITQIYRTDNLFL